MKKVETIEEFYRRKFDWMPDNIRKEIGHFNVFKLEPLVEGKPTSIPYKRRDFYKIMLVIGNSKVHYADKVVEVQKQRSLFPTRRYRINGNTLTGSAVVSIASSTSIFFTSSATLTSTVFFSRGVRIYSNSRMSR